MSSNCLEGKANCFSLPLIFYIKKLFLAMESNGDENHGIERARLMLVHIANCEYCFRRYFILSVNEVMAMLLTLLKHEPRVPNEWIENKFSDEIEAHMLEAMRYKDE